MTEHIQPMMRGLLKSFALIALAAGLSNAASTSTSSVTPSTLEGTSVTPMMDINKTVLEVEKILDKYPELPRIDRSEILSILQNITEEDNEKLKDELAGVLEEEKQKMQKTEVKAVETKEKNRSVMVVLPFQADDTEESLEELFTRSPIVRMEQQKEVIMRVSPTTPKPTTTTTLSTEPPAFSIVEKEDKKFNPPLRIIGYRYHTTSPPVETSTSKTYTNFKDPEQVTMAFRSQEVVTGNQWNHKNDKKEEKVPGIVFNEDLKTNWNTETHPPTGPKTTFHVPDNIDNFSLEDVMISKEVEDERPATTTIRISDISLTTEEPTTQRMYITPMATKEEIVSSSTTKEFRTTTPGSYRKKYKTKSKNEKTTKAPKPDNLASVVDTLPSDMQSMLTNLGLDSKSITSTTTTESPKNPQIISLNPEIDPSSYFKFKPLPLKRQKTISDDMQEFLASFGLLDGNRQQKAVAEETTPFNDRFLETAPEINTDILSESMKKTLDSLGLYERTAKKHIFNPTNHTTVQTEEEVQKLNALLSTIKKLASLDDSEPVTPEFQQEILQQVKELDNITTSYRTSARINEEIHKIMEKNKGKFKIPLIMHESAASGNLNKGPEPEFFEEIQLKNEVKRQENGSATTEEPESSSASSSDSSTTEEPSNSPDLEDAFGGGEPAPEGSDPAESLPPRRPNGLYLLLDWNTFFEVGTDDDARRVNIRFQPKVGDGRNFLPVSIP